MTFTQAQLEYIKINLRNPDNTIANLRLWDAINTKIMFEINRLEYKKRQEEETK